MLVGLNIFLLTYAVYTLKQNKHWVKFVPTKPAFHRKYII